MLFPPHILEIELTGYNLCTGATWTDNGEEDSQGLQACPPWAGPSALAPTASHSKGEEGQPHSPDESRF